MDADAQLHFVIGDLKRYLACRRHDARRERHPHAAAVCVDFLRQRRDRVEVRTGLSGAADDLLQQDRDTYATASGRVKAVLDRDIVVGDDRVHFGALSTRQLRRHLEVHDVAGVVLDDVQDAGPAIDRRRRPRHLVGSRRGEHRTGTRRIEHAQADVAAVHRLVTAATARYQANLAFTRSILADDHVRVVLHPDQVGMGRGHPGHGVLDLRLRRVDQLLQPGRHRCLCHRYLLLLTGRQHASEHKPPNAFPHQETNGDGRQVDRQRNGVEMGRQNGHQQGTDCQATTPDQQDAVQPLLWRAGAADGRDLRAPPVLSPANLSLQLARHVPIKRVPAPIPLPAPERPDRPGQADAGAPQSRKSRRPAGHRPTASGS